MNDTHNVIIVQTPLSLERQADPNEDRHQLLVAKCGALAALFGATILFGCIPFVLDCYFKWTKNGSSTRSAAVVQGLLYFGGGVLFCTTFLHLLPEVQEVVENLQYCNMIPELNFALPELLMCAGFFLMYILDEVIHKYVHSLLDKNGKGADAAFERGQSIRRSHLVKGKLRDTEEEDSSLPKKDVETPENNNNEHHHGHAHDHDHNHSHAGHSHMPVANSDGSEPSPLRGLFIVLALSLHELFEGMAIGLEGSPSEVWFTFVGVVAHKLVLAFCVGVELIVSRTRPCLAGIYMFTFAIVSPIGIFIGIMISHYSSDPDAPSLVSAILQG